MLITELGVWSCPEAKSLVKQCDPGGLIRLGRRHRGWRQTDLLSACYTLATQALVKIGRYDRARITADRATTYASRAHWGQGIATAALAELIKLEPARPLHADAAAANAGSNRVLEKCGFTVTGKSRCFTQARGQDIDLVHVTLS